jgi:hypothetical protein
MPTLNRIDDCSFSIKDRMNLNDSIGIDQKTQSKNGMHGEVLIGKDVTIDPDTGRSILGEEVVRADFKGNEILLAGSIYSLEKLFNVVCDVNIEYLNNIMNIGTTGISITEKYPKDNGICLWTIGLGGCGDNRKDITTVYQQQRQLNNIIPFRVVDEPFAEGTEEYEKYFLMRQEPDGRYAYYGKAFAKTPVIVPLWKDASDDKDGSAVVESDYTSTRTTPIEVFAECLCIIEKEDFREYFDLYDNIEDARFNEIGLVSGILSSTEDGRAEYKQARQVSCCHFTNEPLHMEKDMNIIYRWYSA